MNNNKTMIWFIAFLILAMPIAIAKENAANETVEIKGGKEYPLLERALDRIKLAFTLQIERKTALIDRIQQRRLEHYDFLIAKGKTEQAERFKEQSIGLVKNFDQWKAKKQSIVGRFGNKTEDIRNKTGEAMERKGKPNQTLEKKPEATRTTGRSY